MSIFIGSNGSEKILHLYDGSQNIELAKTLGTSFHSSLPYFKSTGRVTYTRNYAKATLTCFYNPTEKLECVFYKADVPAPALYSKIIIVGYVGATRYFFPNSSEYMEDDYCYLGLRGSGFGSIYGLKAMYEPSDYIQIPDQIKTLSYLTNNTNDIGVREFDKIEVIYFDTTMETIVPSDVSISKSDITVNGSSIFAPKFVHFMNTLADRINDYDEILAIPYGINGSIINYISSVNNLSYSNTQLNGSMRYLQLLNTGAGAITSVSLDTTNSRISVVKNGIERNQFIASTRFKTNLTLFPEILWCSYGQRTGAVNYQYSIGASLGDTVLVESRLVHPTFPYLFDPRQKIIQHCVVEENAVYIILNNYGSYAYVTFSSGGAYINFKWYDPPNQTAGCNFYAKCTLLR